MRVLHVFQIFPTQVLTGANATRWHTLLQRARCSRTQIVWIKVHSNRYWSLCVSRTTWVQGQSPAALQWTCCCSYTRVVLLAVSLLSLPPPSAAGSTSEQLLVECSCLYNNGENGTARAGFRCARNVSCGIISVQDFDPFFSILRFYFTAVYLSPTALCQYIRSNWHW